MELVRNFTKLNKGDAGLAGGKGASLGEMTQAGIPVPPGFVVLSESFEQFIKETDLVQEIDAILHKVNHKEIHTVESASEQIRALILSRDMPQDIRDEINRSFKELDTKYVAVRSSATAEDGKDHAWAGQLESYLNTTEEGVLTKVKLCWSSLFTPRAIFYRFEKGLHSTKISVAVVIQKMVESEISGIAFSVHPVTEDYNQLIIEAGFGLGEAIVSGSVTPDSYVVEKEPRNILDINISTQERALYRAEKSSKEDGNNEWIVIPEPKASSQVLTREQILELSEIILQIENHYGFPCDIEWAFEKGKFYIVQSRPITTLSKKVDNSNIKKDYPIYYEGKRLNWVKFMERKRTPFIYFPFIEIESQIMPKICGFRFYHHLYKWSGDTGLHFRVADEFVKCDNHFLDLINKKDQRIRDWAKKGYEAEKTADKWIEMFSKNPIPFSIEKFEEFYKDFIDVLLYTATMPYLTLSTIDTELTKGATREMFEEVLSMYEPLRNTSKYPELERKVLNVWFGEIAEKYNIDPILVHFMKPEEIRNIDIEGIDKEMLKKRKEWSVFWNDIETNDITFSFDSGIEKNIPVLVEHVESTNVLKGNTAFPGKATGIVRIVNVLEDIKEFNQGDILVSLNTNPDLVPAIKKAGAIVTDEGGIMCHAAIVSREFKIPCVIGTKVATKVLKDGDVVEVDADSGIVRILNAFTVDQDSKTLFGLSRNDYEGLGQWVSPVLEFELWMDWSITKDALSLGFPNDPYPWVSIDGHFFKRKDDAYVFIREKVYSEFKNNTYNFTKSILAKAEELSQVCIKAADSIKESLSFEEFKKYFEMMHQLRFPWMSFFAIDQGSSQYLKEYAETNNLKMDDIVASIPQLPNSLTEDQKKLVEFKNKIDSTGLEYDIEKIRARDRILAEEILTYQKNTEYVGTHHMWGDPRTIDRMLSAISNVRENQEGRIQKASRYPFASVLSEMSKWRLECAQSSAQLAYALRPTLTAFAERLGIAYDDIIQLTTIEIESLIKGDLKDLSFLKERQDKFAIFRLENDITILTGNEYDQVASFFGLDEKFESTEIIKGSVGNKGKVRGIVAIVRRPQDNKKVEKDMILVAPETTPDFIPAMGRAAAFVTDFGGITSHAAIVAREMNKPCIIGTKNATKVLKDGDVVEVDADKGIVRKIK